MSHSVWPMQTITTISYYHVQCASAIKYILRVFMERKRHKNIKSDNCIKVLNFFVYINETVIGTIIFVI
jgi:hypothetical protein